MLRDDIGAGSRRAQRTRRIVLRRKLLVKLRQELGVLCKLKVDRHQRPTWHAASDSEQPHCVSAGIAYSFGRTSVCSPTRIQPRQMPDARSCGRGLDLAEHGGLDAAGRLRCGVDGSVRQKQQQRA